MPVYNAERYIAEAVESILAQTYTDFEFLIIDDGSTDGSLEILKRYEAQDKRIKLKSRTNTGYVVALNEMLAEAKGEFIARMDADDISMPQRFKKQLLYLNNHPECDVLGTAAIWIDPDGKLLHEHYPPTEHVEIDNHNLVKLEASIYHPSVLMRKSVFDLIGYYDENLSGAEDLDIWLKIAEKSQLANLREPLLRYRFHMQKVGIANKDKQNNAALLAAKNAHRRRCLNEPTFPDQRTSIKQSDQLRTWSWWALGSRNIPTARKHAFHAVILSPLCTKNWRALFCAIRGS